LAVLFSQVAIPISFFVSRAIFPERQNPSPTATETLAVAQRTTTRTSKKKQHKSAKAPARSAKAATRSATRAKKSGKTRSARAASRPASSEAAGDREVTIDRRRSHLQEAAAAAPTTDAPAPKLERRKKVNRRRQIDPTTCERDYTDDEVEFMNAIDEYKRKSGRMFPTCSEVLEVVRDLGYVKLSPAQSAANVSPSAGLFDMPQVPPLADGLAVLQTVAE
jgi:hypothetical protein